MGVQVVKTQTSHCFELLPSMSFFLIPRRYIVVHNELTSKAQLYVYILDVYLLIIIKLPMSGLLLEDFTLRQTYVLSYVGTEVYNCNGILLPCYVYNGQRLEDMTHCEIRVNSILNGMPMFKEELEMLNIINHKHVVKVIGSGEGILSISNGIGRMEMKRVEYICLELLYDWNFYLNYISIPDSAIRKIFKKIVKTAAFIHSKGISITDLRFENIKCDKLGIIKITNLRSCLQKPLPHYLSVPFSPSETNVKVLSHQSIGYALGIILLKMMFGPQIGNYVKCSGETFGFCGNSFWDSLDMMSRGNINLSFRDLLQSMLCATSLNQFSFPRILSHPWISLNEGQCDEINEYETMDNL